MKKTIFGALALVGMCSTAVVASTNGDDKNQLSQGLSIINLTADSTLINNEARRIFYPGESRSPDQDKQNSAAESTLMDVETPVILGSGESGLRDQNHVSFGPLPSKGSGYRRMLPLRRKHKPKVPKVAAGPSCDTEGALLLVLSANPKEPAFSPLTIWLGPGDDGHILDIWNGLHHLHAWRRALGMKDGRPPSVADFSEPGDPVAIARLEYPGRLELRQKAARFSPTWARDIYGALCAFGHGQDVVRWSPGTPRLDKPCSSKNQDAIYEAIVCACSTDLPTTRDSRQSAIEFICLLKGYYVWSMVQR
jgi:hypothetical protein